MNRVSTKRLMERSKRPQKMAMETPNETYYISERKRKKLDYFAKVILWLSKRNLIALQKESFDNSKGT